MLLGFESLFFSFFRDRTAGHLGDGRRVWGWYVLGREGGLLAVRSRVGRFSRDVALALALVERFAAFWEAFRCHWDFLRVEGAQLWSRWAGGALVGNAVAFSVTFFFFSFFFFRSDRRSFRNKAFQVRIFQPLYSLSCATFQYA